MATRSLSRRNSGRSRKSPPEAIDVAKILDQVIGELQTAECVVATAAAALEGKTADQLPEIARSLRRCVGNPIFGAVGTLIGLCRHARLKDTRIVVGQG